MVRTQIRARGIRDPRILEAFEDVPRHLFVEERFRREAYADHPLPIGHGQTISQPYMVAAMIDSVRPEDGDVVLEVGAGSGYQAAILARLARRVYTVERIQALADGAAKALRSVGAENVEVIVGDGSHGLPGYAPYDVILLAAGVREIPAALLAQLAEGGRLAAPVGGRQHQVLALIRRTEGRLEREELTPCVFVPLIGDGGWDEHSSAVSGSDARPG
ncbi:MAG: protein-L-isoaspartate(D-aspartate) O-methyltransferase [Planctomycetota bacterium]|nr:protein-L-isoaspartate(D-aspartate) O-methyltransferase [Planctomycetota bacterium]